MKLIVYIELKIKSSYLTAKRYVIAQYKYFTFKIDLFFNEILWIKKLLELHKSFNFSFSNILVIL